MIGKDAVFDRPEQRADQAEQKQRQEQEWQRMQLEAGDGDGGRADFDELQMRRATIALSNRSASWPPSADSRKNGAMKTPPASVTSDSRRLAADLEQDQQGERVLQEVVVEGREELAPEQWRKAPRGEKRLRHRYSPRFAG